MNKYFFKLLVVVLATVACNDIDQVVESQYDIASTLAVNVNPLENTVYEDYYNYFMAKEHGSLDFLNSSLITENGVKGLLRIPSVNNISTGSNKTPRIPSAVLFAAQNTSGDWITHVATYNNAFFKDGVITGHIGLSLINGVEYGRIDNEGKLLDGEDVDKIPSVPDFDTWWSCTTKCYAEAKSACGSDPECDFLCDLADISGGCTLSIGIACGIHCANQGYKRQTDYGSPVIAPLNDQNCFF